jgi:hypothetical protein
MNSSPLLSQRPRKNERGKEGEREKASSPSLPTKFFDNKNALIIIAISMKSNEAIHADGISVK